MRRIPFLDENGTQIGTAVVTEDGLSAEISVDAGAGALKAIGDSDALSLGYIFSSGDKDGLKDDGRRYFVAQRVRR